VWGIDLMRPFDFLLFEVVMPTPCHWCHGRPLPEKREEKELGGETKRDKLGFWSTYEGKESVRVEKQPKRGVVPPTPRVASAWPRASSVARVTCARARTPTSLLGCATSSKEGKRERVRERENLRERERDLGFEGLAKIKEGYISALGMKNRIGNFYSQFIQTHPLVICFTLYQFLFLFLLKPHNHFN